MTSTYGTTFKAAGLDLRFNMDRICKLQAREAAILVEEALTSLTLDPTGTRLVPRVETNLDVRLAKLDFLISTETVPAFLKIGRSVRDLLVDEGLYEVWAEPDAAAVAGRAGVAHHGINTSLYGTDRLVVCVYVYRVCVCVRARGDSGDG